MFWNSSVFFECLAKVNLSDIKTDQKSKTAIIMWESGQKWCVYRSEMSRLLNSLLVKIYWKYELDWNGIDSCSAPAINLFCSFSWSEGSCEDGMLTWDRVMFSQRDRSVACIASNSLADSRPADFFRTWDEAHQHNAMAQP